MSREVTAWKPLMDFSQWLTENGYDAETLNKPENAKQRKHLEAAWKAETQPKPEVEKKSDRPDFDEKLRTIEQEAQRREDIRSITEEYAKLNVNTPEKLKQIRELSAVAIEDTKVQPKDFRLEIMRLDRMAGPMVITPREQPVTSDVLEAAICRSIALPDMEKAFDARTLEISDKQFKRGLSLHGIISVCAKRNGWHGHDVRTDLHDALWCAFRGDHDHGMYAGSGAPSTYSLPQILSNTANKTMKIAFEAVDSAWRQIAAIGSNRDFKQATEVALTGALEFEELGPGGEIKHGTIGESYWTSQIGTTALRLTLDRKSLINDDTGALASAARRLGRGAALKLNKVFWTAFLNNSSFFASGNSNVSTGAGSALGTADGAAINAAEVIFMNQTDPDGQPVGIMPRIILAPPTLFNTATRWMGGQLIVTGANTTLPDANVYQGRYRVVTSPYMENSSYTGYSTAAWYLLADPMDMPVIKVSFLNGNQTPTVETADADFDHLGIMFRGWYDIGADLQEPRAGVRSAGS